MCAAETPFCFDCAGDALVGMIHRADRPGNIGVVIVVGGPQYRIGAHRQFVLLARALAEAGIPACRFDVRGMGDSGGEFPGFEAIDDDIAAAIDAFLDRVPEIDRVVLWGLCDGASASLFYAHRDRRVAGVVLLNPWIRTEASYARTELRHYYGGKLSDPRFWRRLLTGDVDLIDAGRSLWRRFRHLSPAGRDGDGVPGDGVRIDRNLPLPDRMARGLAAFDGPLLLIMSGNDLTAREFDDVTKSSPRWAPALSHERVTRLDLKAADHTFSRAEWTETVNGWTRDWVAGLAERPAARGAKRARTA
jgi:exosortase A-associated hydrolase 1